MKSLSKAQVQKIINQLDHPISLYAFAREIQRKYKEINDEWSGVRNSGSPDTTDNQITVRSGDEPTTIKRAVSVNQRGQ